MRVLRVQHIPPVTWAFKPSFHSTAHSIGASALLKEVFRYETPLHSRFLDAGGEIPSLRIRVTEETTLGHRTAVRFGRRSRARKPSKFGHALAASYDVYSFEELALETLRSRCLNIGLFRRSVARVWRAAAQGYRKVYETATREHPPT